MAEDPCHPLWRAVQHWSICRSPWSQGIVLPSCYMAALVAVMVALGSCRSAPPSEIKLGWGDSLTYNTGFAVTAHLSGRCPCPDRADKSECVYFADAVTEKKIAIFSLTGLLLQTVPLGEVLNNLHQIDGITVLHPDTIVINGKYNNRVAIIDRTGRCSVLADLSDHMRRPDGLTYELWTSNFGPFVLEKHLCFLVSLVANSIGGYCGQDAPRVNETYRYEWLDRNGPHFASLSLDSITDGPRLIWGPTESDKDTIQNIALVHRLGSYACVNGLWFAFSINSPDILILDPVRMRDVRRIPVRSDFTSTCREPVMLPKGKVLNLQDSLNDRLYNGGFIETIHFDRPSQRYLVILRHRVIKEIMDGKEHRRGAYTLQQYDRDFNFINETPITDNKHKLPFMLCLPQGTYVIRSESKREKMRGVHIYDRILLDEQ